MENPQMLVALGFMIATAMACIYAGSHRLLRNVKKSRTEEILKSGDAAAFPIMGSCVLFGLYVALKFIPKHIIGAILAGYLCIASVFSLGAALRIITGPRFLTGVVSVATGAAYLYYGKHWVLNNVLAVAICITGISSLPISNFKTSAILLVGLFFYDVFWVFGTDVMVSVATGIDGPIKILFPQTVFGSHDKKSLLGLGDIVIPGFFVSQTLVFSQLFVKRASYYFRVAMVAYFSSLVNTMGVMLIFNHAQPALLYIVPWLLLSVLAAAFVKGDLAKLLEYDVELVQEKKCKPKPAPSSAASSDAREGDSDEIVAAIWGLVKELFGFGDEDNDSMPKKSTPPAVTAAKKVSPAAAVKKTPEANRATVPPSKATSSR